jgi:hypothetical protein
VVRYDFCKATSYEQAREHLITSTKMVADASNYWLTRLKESADPATIDGEVQAFVEKQYAARNGTIC